jgi:hypothetical protein
MGGTGLVGLLSLAFLVRGIAALVQIFAVCKEQRTQMSTHGDGMIAMPGS